MTHPQRPRDNLQLYRLLGAVFGREREAEALSRAFEDACVRASKAGGVAQDVLYLIWREPWMAVARDTYISQTLALFDWHTQPEASCERYPEVQLASFAGKVDRVLLSSEPYHFGQRHVAEIVAAVDGAVVSLIDGEMTSWYGSRAIEGLRYLTEYVNHACAVADERMRSSATGRRPIQ